VKTNSNYTNTKSKIDFHIRLDHKNEEKFKEAKDELLAHGLVLRNESKTYAIPRYKLI
jgi:hypothetical protein